MIADGVSLLRGQIFEDRNFADIRLSNFIVILDHFSLYFEEDMLTQAPKHAFFRNLDRGRSW